MSVFDNIICKYNLPIALTNNLINVNHLHYQTKDTPAQYLDNYEIREDGTLWHETYDIEDQSDPKAEGFMRFLGCMTRINKRWEQIKFTGEIRFYTSFGTYDKDWIEFSSYFVDGNLKQLHLLELKYGTQN